MDLLLDVMTCSVSEDCNMSPVALEMISGEAVKFTKSSYVHGYFLPTATLSNTQNKVIASESYPS